MSENGKTLSSRVKTYRETLGLTQKDLGERLGISQSKMSQIELGTALMSAQLRQKIESLLNAVSADALDTENLMPIFERLVRLKVKRLTLDQLKRIQYAQGRMVDLGLELSDQQLQKLLKL